MADLYGNIPISEDPQESAPKKAPPRRPTRKRPQRPAPRQSSRRWLVILPLGLLLLFGLYYLLSSTLIPQLVVEKLPPIFARKTGLDLSIGQSRFNPLDTSLKLDNIHITNAADEGGEELLSVASLFVDLDFISLLRGSIVADNLDLRDGTLTITRHPDGTYNVSHFFQQEGGAGPAEVMNFAELPFLYSLNNISIHDSSIVFNDKSTGKKHVVEQLEMNLPTLSNFSYDAGSYIQPRFKAVINGSPIELVGEGDRDSGGDQSTPTRLSCTLQALDLSLYASYLPVPLPVEIRQGKASGKLLISFLSEQSQKRQLTFNYVLQIEDTRLQSYDGSARMDIPLLNVEGSFDPLKSDLAIQNLLVRDPRLHIGSDFSRATVASLFLEDYDKASATGVPLDLPALRVALLITDNATVEVETAQGGQRISPLQFSMRNYANGRAMALYESTGDSSFRLSGEYVNDLAVFSWQGSFVDGVPLGDLEINNLPVARVLPLLGAGGSTSARGTLDVRGRLALRRGTEAPFLPRLSEASARLTDISLIDGERTWLTSSSGRASGVGLSENAFHLGNLFLENSEVDLARENPPALLRRFGRGDGPSLGGLDLQGEILLASKDGETPPLTLRRCRLQLNKLDQEEQKGENFAFSGEVAAGGTLQAKGRVALGPLAATVETAFTGLPAQTFWRQHPPLGMTGEVLLGGSGTVTGPSWRYQGSLELSRGEKGENAASPPVAFTRATIARAAASLDLTDFSGEKIALEDLRLKSDSFRVHSPSASLASVSRDDAGISLVGLDMKGATFTLSPGFSSFFASLAKEGKDALRLEDLHLEGRGELEADAAGSAGERRSTSIRAAVLDITRLDSAPPKKDNIVFHLDIGDGATLGGRGAISVAPLKSMFELNVANVPSSFFLPLFGEEARKNWATMESTINADVHVRSPEKVLSGTAELLRGKLFTDDGTDLVSWDKAVLRDFKYSVSPHFLGIATLELDGPRMAYTNRGEPLYDVIANLLEERFFPPEADTENRAVSFSKLDIPQVNFRGGAIDYVDQRLQPPWQAEISSLDGFVQDFHLSGRQEPIRYGARGRMAGADFSIKGTLRPAEEVEVAELSYGLEDFPLASLNAQLAPFFNLETEAGSIDLHYVKHDGEEATATLALSGIAAEDPDSPTAMMLALLGGKGKISAEVTLGDNDSPTFVQLIRHFQRLAVKTTVSPYLLLPPPYDALVDDNTIRFPPGSAELTEPAEATLARFAQLVTDSPRLRLDLQARIDRNADSSALRRQLEAQEKERVRLENERLLRQWREDNAARDDAAGQQPPAPSGVIRERDLAPYSPVSPEPVVVSDEMLTALGRQRLAAVADFLLDKHAVPEENIHETDGVVMNGSSPPAGVLITLAHRNANQH